MNDIATQVLQSKGLKTVALVVAVTITASFGYFRLDSKADAGVRAEDKIITVECHIRELKNFMIYGDKPKRLNDCDNR